MRTGNGALAWELRRLRSTSDGTRFAKADPTVASTGPVLAAEEGPSRQGAVGMSQAGKPPQDPDTGVPKPGSGMLPGGEGSAAGPDAALVSRRGDSVPAGAFEPPIREGSCGESPAGACPELSPEDRDQTLGTTSHRGARSQGLIVSHATPTAAEDLPSTAGQSAAASLSAGSRSGAGLRGKPNDRETRISSGSSTITFRSPAPPWRLRTLPVCASTEIELDRWLERLAPGSNDPLPAPLAVIARRQRFGRGQQGRVWQSPAGGVWLSAALPWPADPVGAAAPGLAAAVGLALELEAMGLELRLKWPNDLLLAAAGRPAKLAGLLPRLRLRGGVIRWARLGLGLNGCNPVPMGATNLVRELGPSLARPERLAAHVLRGLEWAMAMAAQPQAVRRLAEQRLLVAPGSWEGACEGWQPCGLADDGALLLARGEERRLIRRRFD